MRSLIAKSCLVLLTAICFLTLVTASAEARPHLPRKAAKGAKAAVRFVGHHFPRPFSCN